VAELPPFGHPTTRTDFLSSPWCKAALRMPVSVRLDNLVPHFLLRWPRPLELELYVQLHAARRQRRHRLSEKW
jgi:hypothetical protein